MTRLENKIHSLELLQWVQENSTLIKTVEGNMLWLYKHNMKKYTYIQLYSIFLRINKKKNTVEQSKHS